MKILTIKEVEFTAFRLARAILSFNEPIPDFSSRYPNRLESCLAAPFQTFDKKNLYKGLVERAAVLFYLMVKSHPFLNGNKRIAVTTLMTFLYLNKKWLAVDARELYNFSVWVASSPTQAKEHVVQAIKQFISDSIVKA